MPELERPSDAIKRLARAAIGPVADDFNSLMDYVDTLEAKLEAMEKERQLEGAGVEGATSNTGLLFCYGTRPKEGEK